jgi:murein L,D-transpeptidase YcbB/YkuD
MVQENQNTIQANNNYRLFGISKSAALEMKWSKIRKRMLWVGLLILMVIVGSSYQEGSSSFRGVEPERADLVFAKVFKDSLSVKVLADSAFSGVEFAALQFYRNSNHVPAWTRYYQLSPNADTLLKLLSNARDYGLDPIRYGTSELIALKKELQETPNSSELYDKKYRLELGLTRAGILFLSHINRGILSTDSMMVNPGQAPYWERISSWLTISAGCRNFRDHYLSIQPSGFMYKRLQKGLEKFLASTDLGDEEIMLPDYESDSIACAKAVQNLLCKYGYLQKVRKKDSIHYTNALKKFQRFHGLVEDGKIGRKTFRALQMSNLERFEMAAINLERLRIEDNRKGDYLLVNIPSYKLRVVEEELPKRIFRVIVGNPNTPTPLLESKVQEIISFPNWYVPSSITRNEILPKIKKDSTYLERMNFSLLDKDHQPVDPATLNMESLDAQNFNYKITQEPSRGNSLGVIKFLFPNEYSVYLHDTPSKYLFNKDIRAFSHGCVRLEEPAELAKYLLDKEEDKSLKHKLTASLENERKKYFRLSKPMDIIVRYYTCEGDEENNLYFYTDIYTRDRVLAEKIFNKENS